MEKVRQKSRGCASVTEERERKDATEIKGSIYRENARGRMCVYTRPHNPSAISTTSFSSKGHVTSAALNLNSSQVSSLRFVEEL